MKETVIITRRKTDPFARIDKRMLDDPNLSGLAKWILCYMLGKPPDWKLVPRDLANHCKDGISAIRARLAELREQGYARLTPIKAGGKVIEWQWQIADAPVFKPEKPPDVVIPHLENQYLTKKESTKNKKTSKKPRTPAQQAAWSKLNHTWDHTHYDRIGHDGKGIPIEKFEDEMHDAQTGVKGRTLPEIEDVEF